MKLFHIFLLISLIQKSVNAEAVAAADADAAADANPDADITARSGHIGKTIQNVASNIAHLFDRNRKKKPKRKPAQPTATEIRFVAVRVPVQVSPSLEFNPGPAYGPPSTFNSAYRPPSQPSSAYGPPQQPNTAYVPPSQPSTAYRPPSEVQRRPSYSPVSSNSRPPAPIRPSYKPTYENPGTLRPPRTFLTTTRRPTAWTRTTRRSTTWRTTTWRTTTLRPTTRRTTTRRTTTRRPTTSPQPPLPTFPPTPPTLPPSQSGEDFGRQGVSPRQGVPYRQGDAPRQGEAAKVSRQQTWAPAKKEDTLSWQGRVAYQEERISRQRPRQEGRIINQQQGRGDQWQPAGVGGFGFQQQLGPIETERSRFPSDQQDASAADTNTEESERPFLPIEVLLGVVAGLLTILLLLLAAVLIVLYRRQRRQQVPVKKSVKKKEEVVLQGLPSFPGPKPPPKPPKPLPRDPDPVQRRLPPPPPTWHPPVIYALPGPAPEPWSQHNTHQAEVHRSATGQEGLQVHPKIQARPEAHLQPEGQNHAMNFQPKPVRYMQEASQQANGLKRPPEAGWREVSPPRQPPRQPPPASLDEIQNNQIFRQRSEGRDNPALPPKPPMPRRGSKMSLINPMVKRKISDTTDPEVWGSDFQEVAEDWGRVVALYSYNGEEPGTLLVQPGQQFRLI